MAAQKDLIADKKSFKDTLNLPHTDFPIRAQPKIDDPGMINRWQNEALYQASFEKNKGHEKYVLHDGPPYANGHIHLGHAYNKILKDILTKAHRMSGKHVPVIPGWDCHGLPIEHQVVKEFPGLSAQALKKQCRAHAAKWIEVQREEFKKLGVLMHWDKPYLTMNYSYQAAILRAFGIFFNKGYIEKKKKTVPWCGSCQTVLASAEIEYKERKDPSIYVSFSVPPQEKKIFGITDDKKISLLVWTTTPWTLPLNRAVLCNPKAIYEVLSTEQGYIVVAKELSEKLCVLFGIEKKVIGTIDAKTLASINVIHPFIENLLVPVICDDSVSLQDGTAFVHCAPGCGPEDYEVALKHNLEIFSPIAANGTYTLGILPQELEGKLVSDGQIWVLKKLTQLGSLFFKTSIKHSYPHCWRCHNGLIFRATSQWFCNLSHADLKQRALQAIEKITFLPTKSINYLKATVEGRLEWCLSRQRHWGVPIPAVICATCEYAVINEEILQKVVQGIEREGIEFWDDVELAHLIPEDMQCKQCFGKDFKKEKDILDVWFDSGISHFAVLYGNDDVAFPANIYAEGIDQHRGWFQSSLLTSLVLEGEASSKSFLTHGFTVDDKGHKMSKSLGNVVSPNELIEKIGTDGLRLWVSSINYEGDATVSKLLIDNVGEVYRKIRNTCRFLLSNLYDFDFKHDALPVLELNFIDRYALEELFLLNTHVQADYMHADFTAVFHTLADYCASQLSAFYLDIIKDRLYVEKADGKQRRGAQTVCWYILDTLTRLMAPILSITAEQISDHYQKDKTESIHLQDFSHLHDVWQAIAIYQNHAPEQIDWYPYKGHAQETVDRIKALSFVAQREEQWKLLLKIRSAVLKAIEIEREKGLIKHSLDARVNFFVEFQNQEQVIFDEIKRQLKITQPLEAFFKEFFIVSQAHENLVKNGLIESECKGLWLRVDHAAGKKCPRCWQWSETDKADDLCQRCAIIINI